MGDSKQLPHYNWPKLKPGWVWLTGAGPGDPGLLTLHGLNALEQAEAIVCDALVNDEILNWSRPAAEIIHVGKRGGKPSPKQDEISHLLVELAQAGKRVLRLKGGDPFVFGRGAEEAQTLVKNGISFRIIPGITAGIGGLAYAGIPVTHGPANRSVAFVTGHTPAGTGQTAQKWADISNGADVLVIYMGMGQLAQICAALMQAGRDVTEPVVIVTDATLPVQRSLQTNLRDAARDAVAHNLASPAIICIGPTVALQPGIDWQAYGHSTKGNLA